MADKLHHRLQTLRAEMAAHQLDGLLIWRADMFSGEEVRPCDERLAMISGFTGSAGYALILADSAYLFSDGRYHLQMEHQLDKAYWQWRDSGPDALAMLLQELAGISDGFQIGYDAQTTTLAQARRLPNKAGDYALIWHALSESFIDKIWDDRPVHQATSAFALSDKVTGKSADDKLKDVQTKLAQQGQDGLIISAVDCVNWLFNIRGKDLANTPFHLCFAFVPQQGAPQLIEGDYEGLATSSWPSFCATLPAGHYSLDPQTLPMALYQEMMRDDVIFSEEACPIYLPKAMKNEVELEGFRQAHHHDALAFLSFWYWLETCGDISAYQETDLVAKLQSYRQSAPDYICDSFETIMGSGPNGAIIHYRAEPGADRAIDRNNLLLIDSGGHYQTGTTDITRTLLIGQADDEMRRCYSAVLSAHIACAMARFPQGTTGAAIDAICRAPLWAQGLDYAHGTGHGVGHILSVHEGPAHISKRPGPALQAGMVLSNEPGFYQADHWGIRLENLVAVTDCSDDYLCFETLTFVPFETSLIDSTQLSVEALGWLNDYHAQIYEIYSAQCSDDMAGWLAKKCAPLS